MSEKRVLRREFEHEREKRQENGQKLCKYEIHIMQVFSSPNIILSTKLYCGTCNGGGLGGLGGVEITKILKSKNMKDCVNLGGAGV